MLNHTKNLLKFYIRLFILYVLISLPLATLVRANTNDEVLIYAYVSPSFYSPVVHSINLDLTNSNFDEFECKLIIDDINWLRAYTQEYYPLDPERLSTGINIKLEALPNCETDELELESIEFYDQLYEYDDNYIYLDRNDIYLIEVKDADCFSKDKMLTSIDLDKFTSIIAKTNFKGLATCNIEQQDVGQILSLETTAKTMEPNIELSQAITPVSDRAVTAANLAKSYLGQSIQANGDEWYGWCDKFVAVAYGRSYSGYNSAYIHYLDNLERGLINTGTEVPVGGLAFFGPTASNEYGHVMISIGGGEFVSTGHTIHIETLDSWVWGEYLGYTTEFY